MDKLTLKDKAVKTLIGTAGMNIYALNRTSEQIDVYKENNNGEDRLA